MDSNMTDNKASSSRPLKGALVGVVERISGAKTIRVTMSNLVRNEQYGKYIRRRTRLCCHDEQQEAKVGDTVQIGECRPISRTKSWRLVKVLKRAAE